MEFFSLLKSASIFDIIMIIIPILYISYCTYLSIRIMIDDIKHPFIGVISGYLFVYLSVGFVLSVGLCYGFIMFPYNMTKLDILAYYICSTVSLYNMVIFLIKKYVFNNVRHESLITMFLILLLYFSLSIISIFSSILKNSLVNQEVTNMIDYLYFMIRGTALLNPSLNNVLALVKLIPIITLGILWYHSITKPYDKNELSFYPKSANRTILLFLVYQFSLTIMPYFNYKTEFDKVFIVLFVFIVRLFYLKVLINWVKHKDMELIEKSMIARSKRRYDK